MKIMQRLDDVNPMLCRLLARHRYGKPLSTQALSSMSGIPAPLIEAYSWSPSWDAIPIKEAFRFSSVCGVSLVSPQSMNRAYNYLNKKPTFQYLRSDPKWDEYYRPLLLAWYNSFGGRHRDLDSKIWPPIRKLLLRMDIIKSHL